MQGCVPALDTLTKSKFANKTTHRKESNMTPEKTTYLYDSNAYATEFDATVLICEEVSQNEYHLILDQTLFFPEQGGQSPDKGTINEIQVSDVQINDGIINHTLTVTDETSANAIPKAGDKVHGIIDWTHRFYNMQQHSGEHIFSGIVHSRFGYDNVGFHLSDQTVTMDFNGVMSEQDIYDIEYEVNKAITENIEVQVTFPSKEELEKLEYRSKIEIEGQVRIVTVPGYDVCACCAPHVRRTGEIGMLKVMGIQNYKGGIRVTILCGFRALMAFREKSAVISELTGFLTTGQDKLVDTVKKLKTTNQSMSSQLAQANQTLLLQKLESIPAEQEDVIMFESGINTKTLRNVINSMMEKHSGYCAIFVGDNENGYSYVVGSKNKDCKEIAGKLRDEFAAKGGGNSQMIQGSIAAPADSISTVFKAVI